MTNERAADGRQDAESIEVGEPTRESDAERAAREEERPDLDEREERISEQRKPMGPPLPDTEQQEEARRAPTEGPTDPA
jgi:hypothetical protein